MILRLPLVVIILMAIGLMALGADGWGWIVGGLAVLYVMTVQFEESGSNPITFGGLTMVAKFKDYAIYSSCKEVATSLGDHVVLSDGSQISLESGRLKVCKGSGVLFVLKNGKTKFPG